MSSDADSDFFGCGKTATLGNPAMIRLARGQTTVVRKNVSIGVLSLGPDSIRVSVTAPTNLRIVRCTADRDAAIRLTLADIRGDNAGLEVDAEETETQPSSVKPSSDQTGTPDQKQPAQNTVFITLSVGECVAFADTSEPVATSTKPQQPFSNNKS
jgi:hypothetical protein